MVGYWFTELLEDWRPPRELLDFLSNGAAPLLISLGAMGMYSDQDLETPSLFVEAIQQAGLRAIVQGWEESLHRLSLPDTILAAGPLPHSWLLPHCVGAVHHGGFGTTAACLRAGVPALIIPHIADQFYWAQRVHELGAGPKPIRRTKLEATNLATALTELVEDNRLHEIASSLGEQIQTERGIENAVRLIDSVGCG
jgi:sterol 3beta-glucosyltransferase